MGQRASFGVELIKPLGDKVARLFSVEHYFANGIIYAHDRTWADKVITQCASVPYTSDDHLADTVSQAVRWMADCNWLPTKHQAAEIYMAERMYRPKLQPLYPV